MSWQWRSTPGQAAGSACGPPGGRAQRPCPHPDPARGAWAHPRLEDRPVDADHAATVGLVQACLIGAGRLAVAYAADPPSTLLLSIAARALGPERVWLLHDPVQPPAPEHDALAQLVAASLGLELLHTWAPHGSRARDLSGLPVDSIAYSETSDGAGRAPMRPVGRQRVLHPFATAGLTSAQITRCAHAMGLAAPPVPSAGTGA